MALFEKIKQLIKIHWPLLLALAIILFLLTRLNV